MIMPLSLMTSLTKDYQAVHYLYFYFSPASERFLLDLPHTSPDLAQVVIWENGFLL